MPRALLGILATITLAACSRGEPQVVIPKSAPALVAATEASKSEEELEAARARLARQEAAAKQAEKLGEAAPRAPASAPQPVAPAPRPAEPAPRAAETPKRAAEAQPKLVPVRATAPLRESLAIVPPAGFVEAPKPAAAPEQKAEPPVQVAAAAPVAQRPATPTRVLSRVEPDFPRAAFQSRVERGLVKARMTLDGSGNVTRVDIVEAQPRRVFDNTVTAALSQWKFSDGAAGRTYDTEIVFQR